MDAFLKGKPVAYGGFDGRLYIATFSYMFGKEVGVGELEITDAAGNYINHRIMHADKARAFFFMLDAEAEDFPR